MANIDRRFLSIREILDAMDETCHAMSGDIGWPDLIEALEITEEEMDAWERS